MHYFIQITGIFKRQIFVFTAPTAAPWNFTVVNSSSTTLMLAWKPPPFRYAHGLIRNYVINYRGIHCSDNETDNGTRWSIKTVGGVHTSTNITNLLFWTWYDVRVAAFTVRESPFTTTKKIRTSEHGNLFFLFMVYIHSEKGCIKIKLISKKDSKYETERVSSQKASVKKMYF